MLTAYRIFKTKHAANWFDGQGAFRYGGRWNSPGTRVLYVSQTLSLAVLEILAHLNSGALLSHYSFATLKFDESLVKTLENVPSNWRESPPPIRLQQIGDDWANSRTSAILCVPSTVVPIESNYLVNTEHAAFSQVKLGEPAFFTFDKRLFR